MDLLEQARGHMEKDCPTKAFFFLALEAVLQLKRIADELHKFDEAIDHNYGCVVTRPAAF